MAEPVKRRGAREQRRMARRLRLLLAARRTLDVILAHVRNGGSLIELCDIWQVRYSDVIAWVRADKPRGELYDLACRDRSEWTDEMVLSEIRLRSARFDPRKLYDEHGNRKRVHELDAETRAWSHDRGDQATDALEGQVLRQEGRWSSPAATASSTPTRPSTTSAASLRTSCPSPTRTRRKPGGQAHA
jgi:hypothetical protein